jgi:hypothetical protein
MQSRELWKKQAEAKFLANSFRELAGFAQNSGFPIAAYLAAIAELDVAQQVPFPEYQESLSARGLASRWPRTPKRTSRKARD